MLGSILLLSCLTLVSSDSVVTVNKGIESYWFQTKVSDDVDGNNFELSKITKVKNLFFDKPSYSFYPIKGVSNFEFVEEINFDRNELNFMPKLSNVPNINTYSLQNNLITTLQSGTISSTGVQMLILSSNKISTIEDRTFGQALVEIFLTCNNLTTMSASWFVNPVNVRTFSIGGNKIRDIPANMFKGFMNLKSLNARNNEIMTIGDGALSGPSDLSSLQLSYNNITEIKPAVMGKNVLKIYRLDVQYNLLTFLHPDLLKKLQVENLKLWGNPWQCPCRDEIFKWWQNTKTNKERYETELKRDGDPSCVFAQSFSDVCVHAVDKELHKYFFENFETAPIKFCEIFA